MEEAVNRPLDIESTPIDSTYPTTRLNHHSNHYLMETQWITQKSDPETARKISRILGCHIIIATLLVNRGITTPEAAYTFLHPSMTHLRDPFTLKDMQKAVERIYTALINREKNPDIWRF